jgi:hypothetical protein
MDIRYNPLSLCGRGFFVYFTLSKPVITMKITSQLNFKEYLKLKFILSYQGFFVWFSIFCVVIALISCLIEFSDGAGERSDIIWAFLFCAYIFLRPISIYFLARKSFNTNQILQDKVVYEFLTDKLLITTQYSSASIPWDKMYKIRELKDWFLIYHSNKLANLIPKRLFNTQEIIQVKDLFKSIKGVDVKLKEI